MPLFTPETASTAGKLGAMARWHSPKPEPEPVTLPPIPENFAAIRLSRVREQLNRIDAMILEESDPQRLDRLASAQARLSEQERTLDGRPLPGSMRPSKASTARRPTVSPIEPEQPGLVAS